MPVLRVSLSNPRELSSELCSMFPWVTATPRGTLVEPEVYCRNATDSRPTDGARHFSACPEETLSLAITSGQRSPMHSCQAAVNGSSMSDVVRTVLHSAS